MAKPTFWGSINGFAVLIGLISACDSEPNAKQDMVVSGVGGDQLYSGAGGEGMAGDIGQTGFETGVVSDETEPKSDIGPEAADDKTDDEDEFFSTGPFESECEEQSDCIELEEQKLASLSRPATYSHTFVGATCEYSSFTDESGRSVSGMACICSISDNGSLVIGPVGRDCYQVGRGGDCLWGDGEFSGCTRGDTEFCTTVCDEFETRLKLDAERTFETRVFYATCEQSLCHSVVEIDGRCYADGSYRTGQEYDCSLDAEAILENDRKSKEEPELDPISNSSSYYIDGTDGYFRISVNKHYYGTSDTGTSLVAEAEFFQAEGETQSYGEVIDPLEGVDDCGVSVQGNQIDFPSIERIEVDKVAVVDEGREYLLEPHISVVGSYHIALSEQGVEPRYGGSYGMSVEGGNFSERVVLDGIELPQMLSIPELESNNRIDRDELRLTWTGRGDAPLSVRFMIKPTLSDSGFTTYNIDCQLIDDGEFVIPAEIFEVAPEGFVEAYFRRENRFIVKSNDYAILTIGSINVTHRFALGERCDGSEVVDACLRYAEHRRAKEEECSFFQVAPSPLEVICPDYLAESCKGCPEYFECAIENTVCNPFLTYYIGCSCP